MTKDEFDGLKRLPPLKVLLLLGEVEQVVGPLFDVTVSLNQEAPCPGRRVLHDLTCLWLNAVDHALDQRTRRTVVRDLPRPRHRAHGGGRRRRPDRQAEGARR